MLVRFKCLKEQTKLLPIGLFCLCVSCGTPVERNMVCPSLDTICHLSEKKELIGQIVSISFCDDSTLAVSSTSPGGVYLYTTEGEQLRKIGHSGRAAFEYVNPVKVRCGDGLVVIWCNSTLRFISYTVDGTPISEYRYPSALYDFAVASGKLVIYTAGKRGGHVLDILDLQTGIITNSYLESSPAHQALTTLEANAPLQVVGTDIETMLKDGLEIFLIRNGQVVSKTGIPSKTFRVEALKTPIDDVMQLLEFPLKNSNTLLLCRKGSEIRVLTLEGEKEKQYYKLYRLSGNKVIDQNCFSFKHFPSLTNFTVFEGNIYYMGYDGGGVPTLFKMTN